MLAHQILQQSPLCTPDVLHGRRQETMRVHSKAREYKIIQYVEVMSLYPYICKYFKFTVGHRIILVGDECKD